MMIIKKKKWHEGYVDETPYGKRSKEYVLPSIWDEILYAQLKRRVENYSNRSRCLYGWVIFSARSWWGYFLWGERYITATSEVLARLVEQGCTFSAYRTGYNKYIVDQINHPEESYKLK